MAPLPTMPSRLSNFVGRRKELQELRRLLRHTRLLTLLGPGGAGKTRLATELVRQQASRLLDGAVFAELGEISDGKLVIETIARACGTRLEGQDQLAALFRGLQRVRLLVVDNCEHLVEPAARAVTDILVGCPEVTVIATSRERLNIEGEIVYTVPPLGVPADGADVATADASDAARLFVDRARSVRPGFVLEISNAGAVLTICRRLDGMPLAIELAAARMTTMSPQEIAPRLEDSLRLLIGGSRTAVSRQQTLRGTIDWSYGLLDPTERRLLQRMSVFAGSFEAKAVEEVCAFPPLGRGHVLNALTRLVEKSMVQVEAADGPTHYRLLDTIRRYAAEKLVAEGDEDAVRDSHVARYCRLVDEAYTARRRRGAIAEHLQLWTEMNDVRVALERVRRDPEVELGMLGGLFLVWVVHAPTEGFERINAALDRNSPSLSESFLKAGHAWNVLGGITGLRWEQGPTENRLLQLIGDSDNKFFKASLEMGMGYAAERVHNNVDAAYRHMVTGVELHQAVGPGPQLAMAMGSLGSMEARLGRPDIGRVWIEKAVTMALEIDDQYGAVGAYFHLGYLELDSGTREKALAAFVAGLAMVESGDTLSTADQVAGIACAVAASDPRYALRLFSAASRLRSMMGPPVAEPWRPRVDTGVREARAALSAAEADAAVESAKALTSETLLAEVRDRFSAQPGPRPKPEHGLSAREVEVADLVATGMTSRAIAEKLFLAERTVETHLNHIMTKLGVNSRAQVAAWVTKQGMLAAPGG